MGKNKQNSINFIFFLSPLFLVMFIYTSIACGAQDNTQLLICENSSDVEILNRLVKKRIEHESESVQLQNELRKRQEEFKKCTSQKWRVCWQSRIEDIEKLRVELERQNSRLTTLNREIQDSRNNIFLYCDRMTKELFYGYDEYHCGIRQYFAFIDASMALCRKGDCKEGLTELCMKYADRILQAINSIKDIFKKSQ